MGGAAQAFARARARDEANLAVTLGERLMLPQVYEDLADVARWRARYRGGLDEVEREADRFLPRAAEVLDLNRQNFLLAYQGGDDTELQRRYSALLGRLIAATRPEWRAPRPITFDGSRRLRVGFVGTIFRDCTAGRYFERWITCASPLKWRRMRRATRPCGKPSPRAAPRFSTRPRRWKPSPPRCCASGRGKRAKPGPDPYNGCPTQGSGAPGARR